MKNLGELRLYSGCVYERNKEEGRLTISQKNYAEPLVEEYGVEESKDVPQSVGKRYSKEEQKEDVPEDCPFRKLVGPLTWLATQRRPDIANAVGVVGRHCSAPKRCHWLASLDILVYVRTVDIGITFERGTLGV